MASLRQLYAPKASISTCQDRIADTETESGPFEAHFSRHTHRSDLHVDPRGFTLIELMIVIAIIGIIVAVAVPNFLNFRNRAYCTQAEEDAESIAASISDYYAEPEHTAIVTDLSDLTGLGTISGTISGSLDAIVITVPDPGNCPKGDVFQMTLPEDVANDGWS